MNNSSIAQQKDVTDTLVKLWSKYAKLLSRLGRTMWI